MYNESTHISAKISFGEIPIPSQYGFMSIELTPKAFGLKRNSETCSGIYGR